MIITKHFSKIAVFLFIFLLILIMYFGVFGSSGDKRTSPLINKPVPDFKLKTFDGDSLTLNKLKGNAIVINFWASWCIPCIKEVRILNYASEHYNNQPVKIIGVNIWDDEKAAREFITTHSAEFINGFDPEGRIQVDFGVSGVPETFFINKNGIIVHKYSGELTERIINYYINDTLER